VGPMRGYPRGNELSVCKISHFIKIGIKRRKNEPILKIKKRKYKLEIVLSETKKIQSV
jgi:hypothetical protein